MQITPVDASCATTEVNRPRPPSHIQQVSPRPQPHGRAHDRPLATQQHHGEPKDERHGQASRSRVPRTDAREPQMAARRPHYYSASAQHGWQGAAAVGHPQLAAVPWLCWAATRVDDFGRCSPWYPHALASAGVRRSTSKAVTEASPRTLARHSLLLRRAPTAPRPRLPSLRDVGRGHPLRPPSAAVASLAERHPGQSRAGSEVCVAKLAVALCGDSMPTCHRCAMKSGWPPQRSAAL